MNEIDNGTILPSGLLDASSYDINEAFQKTYHNSTLKIGMIKASYSISDSNNVSKLTEEYDVEVFEQNGSRGATPVTYKNCTSISSFGSIADFFEYTLRPIKKNTSNTQDPTPSQQDGAIVLLLCLNGLIDNPLIIGSFIHPQRKTTLTSAEPQLQGEYNGVNVQIATDGAATLTWKSPTDNEGKVINSSQKPTLFQIQKDGSVVLLSAPGSMFNMTSDGSIQLISKAGNSIFLDDKAGGITFAQQNGGVFTIGNSGMALADSTGKQVVSVNGTTVQITSGATLVEQSKSHTINSGGVSITGNGGVKLKDAVGGEVNIQNGQIAIGNSAAELLSLFNDTLSLMKSLLSDLASEAPPGFGAPLIHVTDYTVTLPLKLAEIQTKLALIKGNL